MARFTEWLDGVDTAASILAVLVLSLIVGGVLGALYYVVTHWPAGYGLGPQGEGFYLAIAFILVIGWVLGQLSWILKRRRRQTWTFDDGSELPLPKINVDESGFSVKWGQPPSSGAPTTSRTWSWNLPLSNSSMRTFKLDHDGLRAARAARAAGAGWEDVCRQVNPDWDSLNPLDRALYQHAIETAVGAPDSVDPPDSVNDRH